MKVRCWFLLSCLCLWINPLVGGADSLMDLIEYFPTGQINWTQGVVTAKGAIPQQDSENQETKIQAFDPAFQRAVQNVYDTILNLRLDNHTCAGGLLADNPNTQTKIEGMAAASKVIQIDDETSGRGEIHLQMSLYGGFAQLILPAEIRQVQPIKPLNGHAKKSAHSTKDADPFGTSTDSGAFTGLIVDARGTGAKPSMVPLVTDEKGREIFGPAYVSREFAVQRGICQYIRLSGKRWPVLPRVASNPLVVKGLRADGPGSCHIVISDAAASKLRGTSSHLEFLKQCRVVIVLD